MAEINDYLITGKSVLEDIQRQINDKAAILMKHSGEVKALQKTALALEKQDQVLQSEIENKMMVIADLDKKIADKAAAHEQDMAPLKQELLSKIESTKEEKRKLWAKEIAFNDQYKCYKDEQDALAVKHKLVTKDRDYVDQQFTALAEKRFAHDNEVAKHNKAVQDTQAREELAAKLIKEHADKKAEYEALILKNKDIETIYKNKEGALAGWEARNKATEIDLSNRIEAVKKEEVSIKKMKDEAIAQASGESARKKELDTYKKNLDDKAEELKYLELKFKQLATQKGIAEKLAEMNG